MSEGQRASSVDDTELFPQLPGGEWRDLANCRGENQNLFYPGYEGSGVYSPEKALGICAVCEVKAECLEFVLETNQPAGIWGGMLEDDRARLRKRRLAGKRRNNPNRTR